MTELRCRHCGKNPPLPRSGICRQCVGLVEPRPISNTPTLTETNRRKVILVLGGLYQRTARLWSIDGEKVGEETGVGSLTYQMHEKNFERFVIELESLAKTSAAMRSLMRREVWSLSGAEKARRLQSPSKKQLRLENLLFHKRLKFDGKYEKAIAVLLCDRGRTPYFNLEFYPRKRSEQKLFVRFVNANFMFRNIERLNLSGPQDRRVLDKDEFTTAQSGKTARQAADNIERSRTGNPNATADEALYKAVQRARSSPAPNPSK